MRGNIYIKTTFIIINIIVSIFISWYFRTYLIENISIEIPIILVNLVHGFSFISIFSVTHIIGEYNGISFMMPFGGGNSTSGNYTGGNYTGGNYTSGNPASSNQGGNVGENQLVHQRGNRRGNRRRNPLLNQGENQRISRTPRRRGNLLVTRSINPLLSQENELSRLSEIITRNRNRNNDLHTFLRERRYVGEFFQGRYVIHTFETWVNPNTEAFYMGRNPDGVDPNHWGQEADESGRLRLYNPHNQAFRGYTLQGQNQPLLRHISSALMDYVLKTGNHVIKESMFSKDELNFILDFLEDKRPDLYHEIMDNPMPSGKPRWHKLRITSDLCTSIREG